MCCLRDEGEERALASGKRDLVNVSATFMNSDLVLQFRYIPTLSVVDVRDELIDFIIQLASPVFHNLRPPGNVHRLLGGGGHMLQFTCCMSVWLLFSIDRFDC